MGTKIVNGIHEYDPLTKSYSFRPGHIEIEDTDTPCGPFHHTFKNATSPRCICGKEKSSPEWLKYAIRNK